MPKKVQNKKVEKEECCSNWNSKSKTGGCGGCAGFGYFLGFIGAAVYNISVATGFWNGAWGFIKALVWPAFVVFELMKSLGM